MGSDVSPSVCLSPIERRASRILSVPPVSWGPLTHTRVNSVYHRHRDGPVVDGGGCGWSGMDGEFGGRGCKLLHLEWVSSEVLLYSTGNCIQSLGMDHNGR